MFIACVIAKEISWPVWDIFLFDFIWINFVNNKQVPLKISLERYKMYHDDESRKGHCFILSFYKKFLTVFALFENVI